MSLVVAIPLGVFFAVIAAAVFSAIDASGEISRHEERDEDEVDFTFTANMAILNESPDQPPWCEVSKMLNYREGFCRDCPEYGHCNRATMVYTHSPRRNGYPWICLKRGCRK